MTESRFRSESIRLGLAVALLLHVLTGPSFSAVDPEADPSPVLSAWTRARVGPPPTYAAAASESLYVVAGAAGDIWTSADGAVWTARVNPDPGFRTLAGATYAEGKFVLVGDNCCSPLPGDDAGVVLTSADGLTWTKRVSSTASGLLAVAYGNALFVAAGNAGGSQSGKGIITSPDAVTWTERSSGVSTRLTDVAAGPGLFVAVGDGRTLITSPDGINWTVRPVPETEGARYLGVTYTGALYVVVGFQEGGGSSVILTSVDGMTWQDRAAGHVPPINAAFGAVIARPGLIVATAVGEVYTSPDGITWTKRPLSWPAGDADPLIPAVADGPAGFLAAGLGAGGVEAGGSLHTSPDGVTWTSRTPVESRHLRAVAHDGTGTFCAVGDAGARATSPDGISWADGIVLPSPPSSFSSNQGYGIFHDGHFIAVGFYNGAILTSPDCITWTSRVPSGAPPPVPGHPIAFLDVAAGGGRLVAVGQRRAEEFAPGFKPTVATSTDGGLTWTRSEPTPGDGHLEAVAYGGGRFVALGVDSAPGGDVLVFTSDDGTTWMRHDPAVFLTGERVLDVAYSNGVFAAVGNHAWTSPDGVTWTKRHPDAFLGSVTFADGRFTAVGSKGTVMASVDGVAWTAMDGGTHHNLTDIAYSAGLGRFVAVGDAVITYTTGDVPSALSIDDVALNEGSAGTASATFTVTLSPAARGTVTVNFATADGTASAGSDFAAASGLLTFPSGVTSQTLTVTVTSDGLDEPDESFLVNLSAPSGATIAGGQGRGLIRDDDEPGRVINFTASAVVVEPGTAVNLAWTASTGSTLTLRSDPPGTTVTVSGPVGSQGVSPTVTTTYTLTATNAAGSTAKAVTVQVQATSGPAAPAISSPSGGQVLGVSGVTFTWTAVAGTEVYSLRVARSGGEPVFSGLLAGTSTLISLPSGTFTFSVQACAAGGIACGRLATVTFTVNPIAPSGMPSVTFPSPGAVLTTSTQGLTWTSVTPDPRLEGMTYEVVVTDQAAGTTALQINVPAPATSTIYTLGSSSSYEIKVRACQAACGPFSSGVTFSVTLPPMPTAAPGISSATTDAVEASPPRH